MDSMDLRDDSPQGPVTDEGGAADQVQKSALARPVRTLLEHRLPFRELSLVAKADQRSADAAYAAHRWWARRPPGVMRGLLLAAAMPDDATAEQFWTAFASDLPVLAGLRVHDPFAGGGSTLVEATRLGAIPSGTDVDPLAATIVRHELNPPCREERAKASSELLRHVEASAKMLFAPTRRGWTPL